jgi:D-erythronate 2-dehydrogenase
LIRHEPDAEIQRIVSGWPSNFDARRAAALGFKAESTFDEIVKCHVEDELACAP